jgi:hypothetical protein
MPPPRSPWPVGTLAQVGLCAAGMAVGAVLALNPPQPDPPLFNGPPGGRGPLPIRLTPPGPLGPRDGVAPMSVVVPIAPEPTDAAGPRSR